MREAGVYLLAVLALGWIAVWAGENLFWTTPAPDLGLRDLVFTWVAYGVAAGAALSAVIWSGLRGWRAAYLGGALLGFAVEGAFVGTMYDAFPAQLVWTPLAWHALISGLVVLGGGMALARGGIGRQVVGMAGLGLFGAVWGLYWPLEGKETAGLRGMLAYLGLAGLGVVLALGVLSRLDMPGFGPAQGAWRGRWWLWLAPGAVVALWALGTALAPDPVRLIWPAMVGITVWAMGRLGRRESATLFGPPLSWGRCGLFLLAPLVTVGLVLPGWARLGGVPVNVPVALLTGAVGLGLWLWLLLAAVRQGGLSGAGGGGVAPRPKGP
ncbi:hypothetical protein [Paragemmobacter ruber]|uniref:DUF998 domain-containing protein n=1 Tax=Paragemmobacter ruber TaxID=1985673 RepID=A0ABW9Y198_9RHOB|nr:hypothetical protein [Rhodobacter ruber]NBE06272.1 hypothetical protein [Rhodobacter ruber]